MDRRKNNRSLRASAEGVKIKVKSTSATPTSVLMEDQNPSIYEIDILSSLDFHKNKKKETNDVPIKMSVAKPGTRVLGIKREESTRKCRVMEIPLLESYYPTFQQAQSKVKSISFKKEKMDSKIQTDSNFKARGQEEKEKKTSEEKIGKQNHSPSEDLKEFLKNIMIDSFNLKEDSGMKMLFKNLYENLNKDQLHLHHHEHHHHYYFDNSTLLNEKTPSFPFKQTFMKSQKVKSAGESKVGKDKKRQTGKARVMEREQPTHTYYFKCPRESNLTFTKTSSGIILKSESNESSEANKTSKIKGKKPSGTFELSPLKFSSSVESILNKKSDFITTHIYSDTELKKCDSEMLHAGTTLEFKKASSKEPKTDENNDYTFVLNELKNFNHFTSPKTIATQKTAPQISYIKCECASLENSSTVPNNRPFFDIKNEAAKVANQEKTRSAETRADLDEYVEEVTGQYDHEIWTTKLKTELGEIKKELKRIEEKHLRKRKSFTSLFNNNKSIEGSESSHNITVYSSKTFIIGTDSLYVMHDSDQEQFEDEIESVSKIKLAFQGTGNNRERWQYREKRSFFEKTVLSQSVSDILQRNLNKIFD